MERDIYSLIKESVLGQGIKGKVYRSEMRPADATTEDIVIKFLAGEDEQVQIGVVICSIYVPDILKAKGRMVIDHARIAVLEELALEFIETSTDTEYLLKTDGSMTTYSYESIGQHVISMRIKFQRLNQ